MAATATASNEEVKDTVATEVPPALDKLLLLMVKNFYCPEQFILVYYIMRAVCIKEDTLRTRVHFEHKQMREWMAQLKRDKIVRERLLTHKNENNRSVNIIFYFINYRALRNILMFKIDHMRQRLETKEKDTTQKAHYKCNKCGLNYETLDMRQIFNIETQTLVCWRCQGEVEQDLSAGPTIETRSLLARFNEQMTPLFAAIRELAGIQLAPHLYEPDINKYIEDPAAREEQQLQLLDFSGRNMPTGAPMELGGVAFRRDNGNRSAMLNREQIIVDLNAGSNNVVEEQKAVPTWLTDSAIGGENGSLRGGGTIGIDNIEDEEQPVASSSAVDLTMLAELEGLADEEESNSQSQPSVRADAEPASVAKEEFEDGLSQDSAAAEQSDAEEDDDDDEEEEPMLACQGVVHALSEITPDMVEQMTDEEKEAYVAAVQAHMDY